MRARIYRPAKNAMQSGKARTKLWQLEYEPETPRTIDPLMGWTSSGDMRQQLCLEFDTAEEAVAYAKANAIPYQGGGARAQDRARRVQRFRSGGLHAGGAARSRARNDCAAGRA